MRAAISYYLKLYFIGYILDFLLDVNMDQCTLQIFEKELTKIRNETSKVKEFCTVKKDFQEMIRDLQSKNQVSLRDLPMEKEELDKEIEAFEKELFELEILLSKETSLLAAERKMVEDEAQKMKMMVNFKAQYNQRLLEASAVPSKNDIELLEKCRKKLEAYVKMTGVVWDFESCDKNTLCGYIRNPSNTKAKMFKINIEGKSRDEISDEMWKLIKKYSMA